MSNSNALASATNEYTQRDKIISIESPLGTDALLLTSVKGEDALSRCFLYTVEFVTKTEDSEVRSLIGQPVTIWLQNHLVAERQPINGFVRRVIDRPSIYPGYALYRAEIVPRLWFLDCTSDCRIFQSMTYPAIIRQILDDNGLSGVQFKLLKNDYPQVDYCVQYRESSLAFISRLMEHAGIFFFHEHTESQHTLIITDTNEFTSYVPNRVLNLSVTNRAGDIKALSTDTVFRPGAWSLSDYDFEGPTKFMKQQAQTSLGVSMMPQHERFDFPGGYTEQSVGLWLTELRMQADEAQFSRTLGTATSPSMLPGYRFQLDRDNGKAMDVYLLTEVRHTAREDTYFSATGVTTNEYSNEFVAIAAHVPFRPQRVTPKSIMQGAQTATVVSATANDPIQTDVYGRVKVHFHWDRHGQPASGATSCWLRVAQNSAGAGFGGIATPHAGQEVIVDFLEGDPDRPLITGRVHNADKVAPIDLPYDKHKTVTRDHGSNKIVMSGEPGNERLNLHSPKNINVFALRSVARSLSAGTVGSDAPADPSTSSTTNYTLPSIVNNFAATEYAELQTAINGGTTSGPDSNTAVEGNINEYSSGNMNNWCNSTANSWVWKGTNAIVYEYVNTEIYGFATSMILGNNMAFVGGANESVVVGLNYSGTLGASVSMVLGITAALSLGGFLTINKGWGWTILTPSDARADAATTAATTAAASPIAAAAVAASAGSSTTGDWKVTATGNASILASMTFETVAPLGWTATVMQGPVEIFGDSANYETTLATTVTAGTQLTMTGTAGVTMSGAMVTITADAMIKIG